MLRAYEGKSFYTDVDAIVTELCKNEIACSHEKEFLFPELLRNVFADTDTPKQKAVNLLCSKRNNTVVCKFTLLSAVSCAHRQEKISVKIPTSVCSYFCSFVSNQIC